MAQILTTRPPSPSPSPSPLKPSIGDLSSATLYPEKWLRSTLCDELHLRCRLPRSLWRSRAPTRPLRYLSKPHSQILITRLPPPMPSPPKPPIGDSSSTPLSLSRETALLGSL